MREFIDRVGDAVHFRSSKKSLTEARALGIQYKTPEEMALLLEEATQKDFGMSAAAFREAFHAGTLPTDDPNVRHDAILAGLSPQLLQESPNQPQDS